MEERIKELKDIMDMINNYQILGTSNNICFVEGTGKVVYTWYTEWEVYVRRTEYSKIILITYDEKTITKTYNHEYDDKMLSYMGIDDYDIITIKDAINDELETLGAEPIFE